MYDSMIADLMDHLLDLNEDPLQSLESQLKFRMGLPAVVVPQFLGGSGSVLSAIQQLLSDIRLTEGNFGDLS